MNFTSLCVALMSGLAGTVLAFASAATEAPRKQAPGKAGDPKVLYDAVAQADMTRIDQLLRSRRYTANSYVDAERNTPLHLLASRCEIHFHIRYNISRYLMNAWGADRQARNNAGETPWQVAQSKCNGPTVITVVLREGHVPIMGGPILPSDENLARAAQWQRKADESARRGAWDDAYWAYLQASKLDAYNPVLHHGMAVAAHRLGDPRLAAAEAKLALKLDPDNPAYKTALEDMARAQELKDQQARAAKDQRAAQQARSAALLQRAEQLRLSGALQEAINVYGQARQLDPTNASILNGEGLAHYQLEKYALAEWAFKTALQHDPNNRQIQANLASAQQAIANHKQQMRQLDQQYMQQRAAAADNDAQATVDAFAGLVGAIAANRAAQQQAAQQQAQQRAQQQAAWRAQQAREAAARQQQQRQQQQQQAERLAQQQAQQARENSQQQNRSAAQAPRTIPYGESLAMQQQRNLEAQRMAQQQSAQKPTSSSYSPPPEPRGLVLGPNCQGLPAGSRNCGFAGPDTVDRERLAREKREFEARMRREDADKRAQQAQINRRLQQDAQRNIDQATAYRNDINAKNEQRRRERENFVNSQASRSDAVGRTVLSLNNCPTVRFHNRTDINLSVTYHYKGTVAGGKEGPSGSWTTRVGPKGTIDSQIPGYFCDANWRVEVYEVRWEATRDNYYTYPPA